MARMERSVIRGATRFECETARARRMHVPWRAVRWRAHRRYQLPREKCKSGDDEHRGHRQHLRQRRRDVFSGGGRLARDVLHHASPDRCCFARFYFVAMAPGTTRRHAQTPCTRIRCIRPIRYRPDGYRTEFTQNTPTRLFAAMSPHSPKIDSFRVEQQCGGNLSQMGYQTLPLFAVGVRLQPACRPGTVRIVLIAESNRWGGARGRKADSRVHLFTGER